MRALLATRRTAAPMQGRPVNGYPKCFLPHVKLYPREIYARGGGLLVAPVKTALVWEDVELRTRSGPTEIDSAYPWLVNRRDLRGTNERQDGTNRWQEIHA